MLLVKTLVKLLLGRGSFRSYSQAGEDGIIRSLFRKEKGFYVDVGAYHPHLYSNTYALYRAGWSGLALDPNPEMAALFKAFRPRDMFVCAGVGEGTLDYYQYQDAAYNGFTKITQSPLVKTYPVTLKPLAQIVKEQGVTNIDFLNVDVEGFDLEVLQSYDWSLKPRVIAIEARLGSSVQSFLEEKGYELAGVTTLNLIFKLTS